MSLADKFNRALSKVRPAIEDLAQRLNKALLPTNGSTAFNWPSFVGRSWLALFLIAWSIVGYEKAAWTYRSMTADPKVYSNRQATTYTQAGSPIVSSLYRERRYAQLLWKEKQRVFKREMEALREIEDPELKNSTLVSLLLFYLWGGLDEPWDKELKKQSFAILFEILPSDFYEGLRRIETRSGNGQLLDKYAIDVRSLVTEVRLDNNKGPKSPIDLLRKKHFSFASIYVDKWESEAQSKAVEKHYKDDPNFKFKALDKGLRAHNYRPFLTANLIGDLAIDNYYHRVIRETLLPGQGVFPLDNSAETLALKVYRALISNQPDLSLFVAVRRSLDPPNPISYAGMMSAIASFPDQSRARELLSVLAASGFAETEMDPNKPSDKFVSFVYAINQAFEVSEIKLSFLATEFKSEIYPNN